MKTIRQNNNPLPCRHLPVQSQQWKHHNNVSVSIVDFEEVNAGWLACNMLVACGLILASAKCVQSHM